MDKYVKAGFSTGVSPVVSLRDSQLVENPEETGSPTRAKRAYYQSERPKGAETGSGRTSVDKRIETMIQSKKAFLFMKGSPDAPQCGFSMAAVQTLQRLNIEFGSFDVLSDDKIREGIKEYGNWPTIPQLYINGVLVGGSDIIGEMAESGELQKLL
jgi:monothiol glutaredoxin